MKLSQDQKRVFEFIKQKDINSLSTLIPKIKIKEFFNTDGKTPFMCAMENYDLNICKLLSDENFPIEAIDGSGSAILAALINSDIRQLDIAVDCGANIDAPIQTSANICSLAVAINRQNISFAKKLIDIGAKTDIFTKINQDEMSDEFPLLFIAAQANNFEIFDYLLDRTDKFYSKNGISIYWVLLCASMHDRDIDKFKNQALKVLIEKKIPFDNKFKNGDFDINAMSLMFTQNMESREKSKREKLILKLINEGIVEYTFKDMHKNNLLKLSVRMGSVKLTEHFMLRGLSPYDQDDQGYSCFHNAAALKDSHLSFDIINILIGKRSTELLIHAKEVKDLNLNLTNEDGSTAVDLAFTFNNYNTAKVLIENGEKLPYSAWNKEEEVIPLWVQLICHICTQEDVNNLIYFIDKGLDISKYSSSESNFDLSIKSVVGSRILLQKEFKNYGSFGWKGYYDENNAYPKIDFGKLYEVVKSKKSKNSKIGEFIINDEEIENLIGEKYESS